MNSGMNERIIDGAAVLFSERGYSGVRVDDIAGFVGISKKTIYNHFPNKSSLFGAVLESNTRRICKGIDNFDPDNGKSLNWLKQIYSLIVFCCRELSQWLLPASEAKENNMLSYIVEKSLEDIRQKIKDRAERFFDTGTGGTIVRDNMYYRALISLYSTVVEGVFTVNGLCREDEIELNPLINSLKAMADAYEVEHGGLPVDPEPGRGIRKKQEKHTSEELKQRIKELENESVERKQVEDDLRTSKDRLSLAMEISEATPWEINLKTCKWHCDREDYEAYGHETKEEFDGTIAMVESTLRYLKYTDEILHTKGALDNTTHPDDRDRLFSAGKAVLVGEKSAYEGDFRMLERNGRWAWYYGKAKVTGWDKEGNPEILSGLIIDITERKKVEEKLREREARLASQTHTLEETNTALRVLLKSRDEDKKEFEEKIITNLKEMVFPFIEKLKSSRLDERQAVYLDIIQSHLDDMIAPFLHQLSSKYSSLTPAEIKVAVFVKEGRTTKEIAELLNSSIDAVNFHRNNLRKKFGLVNSKTNLRTHLLSLS